MLQILAVDDELPNLETLHRVFRRRFALHPVQSGALGLEALNVGAFDLALVDFSMPKMNGLQFAREARSAQPDLPIVIVTGYGDLPELHEAVRQGLCKSVLAKPWTPGELLEVVQTFARVPSPPPPAEEPGP